MLICTLPHLFELFIWGMISGGVVMFFVYTLFLTIHFKNKIKSEKSE